MKNHEIQELNVKMDGTMYTLKRTRCLPGRFVCKRCCFFKEVASVSTCCCPNSSVHALCLGLRAKNKQVIFKKLADFDALFSEAQSHRGYWNEQKRIVKGECHE